MALSCCPATLPLLPGCASAAGTVDEAGYLFNDQAGLQVSKRVVGLTTTSNWGGGAEMRLLSVSLPTPPKSAGV